MDALTFIQFVWRAAEVASSVTLAICAVILTLRHRPKR